MEESNVGLAIRTFLRESTTLISTDYVGDAQNILLGFPNNKTNPLNIPPYVNRIVIFVGRGGAGELGLAQQEERVDIFCYGTSDVQCKKIWRAMDAYLNPESVGVRRKRSFTRNNCQVNMIFRESGPISLPDPDAADWPYTMAPYIVNYNSEPRA